MIWNPERTRLALRASMIGAAALALAGCRAPSGPVGYFGPTLTLNEMVASVNSNNNQIPTLRGRGSFKATIVEGSSSHELRGALTMLYGRPRSLRMVCQDPILGPILEAGSNDERYWVIVRPPDDNASSMSWGTYEQIDKVDSQKVPIRPDLLLEVLGVLPISTEFLQEPSPVLRFNSDADAYMVVWQTMQADRWIAQKEIWYDRKTLLPMSVQLYDKDGRVILRAYLQDHRPVSVEGVPKEQWPKLATQYRLFFPDTGSKLEFSFSEELGLHGGTPAAPNERSFIFPQRPSVSRIIPLDRAPTTQSP